MIVLYCQKRKLEAHSLPSTILQFFCFIIETALLCSSLAVVELALFVKYNQYAYFAVVAVPMSKIYSNSLMVVRRSVCLFTYQANAILDLELAGLHSRTSAAFNSPVVLFIRHPLDG